MAISMEGAKPVGCIVSTAYPGVTASTYCAQFHRELPSGQWVRGTGEEAVFNNEDVAFEWLCELGCMGMGGSIAIHPVHAACQQ